MRKILVLVVTVMLIFSERERTVAQSEYFGQEDILATSSEFEKVSALYDEMIKSLAAFEGISAENAVIDYERAVKIYADTDIFQLDTDDGETILEFLGEGEHIWMVPASLNGKKYLFTISKGHPLTEDAKEVLTLEEQQEVIDREGNWFVCGIEEADEGFWEKVNARSKELEGCQQAVIIVDLPGFQYPVVLGIKEGKAARWINIGYDNPVMDDVQADTQTMSKSVNTTQEGVYEFHELADRVESYYNLSSGESGGTGSRAEQNTVYWGYILSAVLVGSILVAIILKKSKSR